MTEDLLDQLATQQRKTGTGSGDNQGGRTKAFASIATDIPCRTSSPSGKDVAIAGQKKAIITHVLYFAPTFTPPKVGDRFIIGSTNFDVRVPNAAGPSHPYVKTLVEEYQGA